MRSNADIAAALRHLADVLEQTDDTAPTTVALRIQPNRGAYPRFLPATAPEVARIYREALAAGQPPTRAVRDHFALTDAQAGKWVTKTRDAGHLPPTTKGVPAA